MKVDRRNIAAAGALALALAGGVQAFDALASPGDPQLGLRVATPHIDVERMAGDPYIWADLETYVAVTGAPLQVEAVRAADGTADLWLVHRRGDGTIQRDRQIQTPTRKGMELGLPGFLDVKISDSAGAVVSQQSLSYCPGGGWFGYSAQRIDASGPAEPTMPTTCGSQLTQRMVQGLDEGWATAVGNELLGNFQGPDGDYTIRMGIATTYATQLGIPADRAGGTVTMSVTTVPCPYDPQWCPGSGGGGFISARGDVAPGTGGVPLRDGAPTLDPVVRAAAADVDARAARTATLESSPALRIASSAAHSRPSGGPDADRTRRADGLPDLVPLPAFALSAYQDDTGADLLTFGANLANLGSGPLVVEGYRTGDTMKATQFEYRDGAPVRSFPAGEFEWDPREGHTHWHVEDIAQYDLVAADGSVSRSGKQAFCLAPTDPVDLTLPGAVQRVETDRMWSACGGASALWIREVLPAGWGDTYYQGLPGQAFDITGLPNGQYTVRVTTNVRNRIHETNTGNNVSLTRVQIGGEPGARTVTELA